MRCANCGNPKVKYINENYKCAYCKKTIDYCMPDYLCKEIDGLLADPNKNAFLIDAKKVRYPGLDWDGISVPIEKKKRTAADILAETKIDRNPSSVHVKPQSTKSKSQDFFRKTAPTSNTVKSSKKVVISKNRCPKCGSEFIIPASTGYECKYCGDAFSTVMVDYQAKEIEELLTDPVKNRAHIEVKEIRYPAIRWDGYSAHKEMKRLSGEHQAQKSLYELKKALSSTPITNVSGRSDDSIRNTISTESSVKSIPIKKEKFDEQDYYVIDEIQGIIIEFMNPFIDRLGDQKVVKSLLSDCLPENALERNLMINAYVEGVCDEIRMVDDRNIILHRMSKKLVDNYGIMQEKAEWAVATWINLMKKEV